MEWSKQDNTCESPLKRYSLHVVIIIIMPHCTVNSSPWAHQPRAPLYVTWLILLTLGNKITVGEVSTITTIFIITTIILFIIISNSSSVIVNVTVLIIPYCFLSTYQAISLP